MRMDSQNLRTCLSAMMAQGTELTKVKFSAHPAPGI